MLAEFERNNTRIPGCLRLSPPVQQDERGSFVKIYNEQTYTLLHDAFDSKEEFYSVSRQRVLRGLHFQRPPAEAAKLIHCISGSILDVVVDLRCGSPFYGQHEVFELSGNRADMLFIPPGLAHGFYVLSAESILLYKTTREYSPQHDTGIHWASAGIAWPDPEPIVSARDCRFVALSDFHSPFRFEKQHD